MVGAPDDATAAALLDKGYRPEGAESSYDRVRQAAEIAQYDTTADKIGAFAGSALSAATLGLSDAIGADEGTRLRRLANPRSALAGQIVGAVAPAFAGDIGGLLPAGIASRTGAAITELGAGASLARKTAAAAAGAGFEGALQSGGAYISQVALGDKDLSAEGFLGAMGDGAMFGGILGGGAAVAESALVRARGLFPKLGREAVGDAHNVATTQLSSAMDEADQLQAIAVQRLDEQQAVRAQRDPVHGAEMQRIRLEGERARQELRVAAEQEKLTRQTEMTRKTFEKGAERPTRKTFEKRPADVVAEPVSALEQQLAATKSAIDDGASIGKLSKRPKPVEDQLHDALAQVDPTAADLIHATRTQRMAKEDVKSWIANMKSKADPNVSFPDMGKRAGERAGWKTRVGADFEERTLASVNPAERAAADDAVNAMMGPATGNAERIAKRERDFAAIHKIDPSAQVQAAGARMMGRRIVNDAPPQTTEQIVNDALRTPTARGVQFTVDEVHEGAKVIGAFEKANADLVAALGDDAVPIAAQQNAQQYHAAVLAQHEGSATTAARATDAVAGLSPSADKQSLLAGLANGPSVSAAANAGSVLEMLSMAGLGVPTAKDIPIVGPILSLYLKARALAAVAGRAGAKLPKSTESIIAGKAAATQRAVTAAVDKAFDISVKATKGVQRNAGKTPLMMRLFDYDDKKKPATTVEGYQHRLAELTRASQPGAVSAQVRAKVPSADVGIVDAIAAAAQRKYDFLLSKAPKSPRPSGIIDGKPWEPSRSQLRSFERYVQAAEHPVSVFESAARGEIDFEGIETVKVCYPRLFQEAQRTLIQNAEKLQTKLPYQRRLALSAMFGVAVDPTMSDGFIAVMQKPDEQSQPQPPPPSSFGNLSDIGATYSTRLDRRGV